MSFKPNLFIKEVFLFGATLVLSIFLARNYVPSAVAEGAEAVSFSMPQAIFMMIFFIAVSVLMIKFKSANRVFLRFFLALVVFSGAQTLFGLFLDFPWNIGLALVLVFLFHSFSNVLFHDLGMIIGISGISGILGTSMYPETGIMFLVALSFYDILAVYWTKHMVYMAKGMIESGAIFGFIIPFNMSDILLRNEEVRPQIGDKFMVLGSGDIGLPAIFVSSVAVISVREASIVAIFSVAGLLATHLIFVNQKEPRPMAALPPIATLTVVGYLVAQLF